VILVDTSVWVDHLRTGDEGLAGLLERAEVFVHAFVIGELACGALRNRDQVLRLLSQMPRIVQATDPEVLHVIERHDLAGQGIGYIDAHLLASALLASPTRIWTRDRRLREQAERMEVALAAD
jgi:hypothetical protein